ncbi:MAG: DUF5947 family protein [Gaiellaceae bacterium]
MTATASRLRRLAAPSPSVQVETVERCDLCSEPIAPQHRHVVDLRARSLLCACRACVVLLDRPGAGGSHFQLVPERRLRLDAFRLDDAAWAAFRIPVDLAFFFHSTATARVTAVYPGALGATESQLDLDAWEQLALDNPVLGQLAPDVEALLVNRAGSRREHYLVPIDDCYALAGVLRTHWKGFAGGGEVWREIDSFFERLRAQSRPTEEE